MSHSEEIWRWWKFAGSNRIGGKFGEISKEQTIYRSYSPIKNVGKMGLNWTYC